MPHLKDPAKNPDRECEMDYVGHSVEERAPGFDQRQVEWRDQTQDMLQRHHSVDPLLHERQIRILWHHDALVQRPLHVDETRQDLLHGINKSINMGVSRLAGVSIRS